MPEPFEAAVDAIVNGDAAELESLLQSEPELLRARSAQPHRATLLHYLAANGVENSRQKTPANAVQLARTLLRAGADVNATAPMYGAEQTTMKMLVSSAPPAEAGLQVALVDTLVDYGASVDGALLVALAHGYRAAAEALVRRGAPVDNLAAAAGLGQLAQVKSMVGDADDEERQRALALAAQHGHAEIVALLLDAGADPSRFNPSGYHGHSTPLHQAALAGHEAVVRLLVERGAPLDVQDRLHGGTPLGWAIYGGQNAIAAYLQSLP